MGSNIGSPYSTMDRHNVKANNNNNIYLRQKLAEIVDLDPELGNALLHLLLAAFLPAHLPRALTYTIQDGFIKCDDGMVCVVFVY